MGRPDIMLTPKGGQLTPKARREFQRQWDSAYGGPDKAGKVYVANQDVELKDFGFSPREMAFLQGRTWTRTEICAMFPVPVGIFDVKDISKAPKAALDGTADFMARYNTRPRAIRMEQKLNEQLAPRYDDRLFFAFDDPVSDDREGRLKEIETMLTNYVQTVNEIRQDEGLPPVPWGDTPLVSMNTISLGSSPNANTGEPTKNALKALPADPNDCPANLIIKADGTVDRERTGGPNRALTQEEQEIAAIVNDVFVRQAADVDQNVAKAASDELPLFDAQKWTRELGALLFPLLIPAYQRGATNGLVQARVTAEDWDRIHPKAYRDTGVTKALNLSDWVESPEVIEAMKNRAFTVASVVNAKTLQKLQDQLVIGMQEGESIAAIQKRLRSTYKKWDRVRAARVARTEVIHAYNDGKIAAWSESEVVEGKEWNASGDACPFCLEMNGKVLPLNGAYHELGSEMNAEYQGQQIRMAFNFEQINGPPLHPNCRCALIPVVE